jgi:hypothetical protein
VLESQRLEKILIDDIGARGDDGVDHAAVDQVHDDLLQPRADDGTGEAKDDRGVRVPHHPVEDLGPAVEVPRLKGQALQGVHVLRKVVLFDVDVLDGALQVVGFGRHVRLLGKYLTFDRPLGMVGGPYREVFSEARIILIEKRKK